MGVERMDHVGIVLDDLEAATEFFVALGLEAQAGMTVEGDWVGRIIGLDDVRSDIVMLRTPDGNGGIELVRFRSPPNRAGAADAPSNARGLRHLTFAVDDLDAVIPRLRACGGELVGEVVRYQDIYRLCYVRGPEGILIELAERLD